MTAPAGSPAGSDAESGTTDPFHRLLNCVVYAPIGVLSKVRDDLPGFITAGRQRVDHQLTVAKFLGKMVVRQVKAEIDRVDAIVVHDAPAAAFLDTLTDDVDDGDDDEMIVPAAATDRPVSLPEAIIEAVAEQPELADESSLPIDGYASLAASQVVLRLGSLTPAELDAIEAYESTHRARRTILGKIQQVRAL